MKTTIYDASILLVDDNPDLLTLVTDNLRTAGYKKRMHCRRLRRGTGGLRRTPPGPDDSGHQPAGRRRLRVIPHPADRIGRPGAVSLGAGRRRGQAVRAGAWRGHYLTKPFLMQELLLRVQHLLRRAYRTELRRSRVLTLGGLHGQFAGRRRPPR